MAPRKCINLNPVDHETLAALYLERRIATDRYMHRHNDLQDLTAAFNGLTGRDDSPEELLHYMQTKRRTKGQWPKLNGTHRRLPVVIGRLIDPESHGVLCRIYGEFDCGPETIAQDRDLSLQLERRFFKETGIRKRGYVLATALIEIRKAGDLPTHGKRSQEFNDFADAERMSDND